MTIAPRLLDANGETDVLLQLERARLTADMSDEEARAALRRHAAETQASVVEYIDDHDGIEIQRRFWVTNAVLVTVDADTIDLQELADLPGVEAVLPNEEIEGTTLDSKSFAADESQVPLFDAASESQRSVEVTATTYGLAQINAPAVWQLYDTRGDGAKVAVLDTGVDASHPDITLYTRDPQDPTFPGGWGEFDEYGVRVEGSTPFDTDGHGTHVSGTVAGGNESGLAIGVAPEVDLIHGQVLPEGSGTDAQIIAGVEWAIEEDADIASLSLGGPFYQTPFLRAIQNAEAAGTVFVGSSGNFGEGTADSPGNVYDAVSVGATDRDESVASFSGGRVITTEHAWGDRALAHWPESYVVPDVTAPGVAVTSAAAGGGTRSSDGTSMAAPHVAGTLALLISASDDDHSPEELKTALYETARKPADAPEEQDIRYGWGIADALAATQHLTEREPSVVALNSSGTDFDGAVDLPPGVTANEVLEQGDVDVFAIEVAADDELEVTLRRGSSGGVSAVALYDVDRRFVGITFAGTETPVTLEEIATESGTYYVQVLDVEAGTGPYSLSVTTEDVPVGSSELEPNDEPALATPVTIGARVSGEVSTPDDIDYFTFQADDGDRIETTVTRSDGQGLFEVELLDARLRSLATAELGVEETTTLSATANRSGAHFVVIRSADDRGTGAYSFAITTSGAVESERMTDAFVPRTPQSSCR